MGWEVCHVGERTWCGRKEGRKETVLLTRERALEERRLKALDNLTTAVAEDLARGVRCGCRGLVSCGGLGKNQLQVPRTCYKAKGDP